MKGKSVLLSSLLFTIALADEIYSTTYITRSSTTTSTVTLCPTSSQADSTASAQETLVFNPKYLELAKENIKAIKKDQECYFTSEELYEHAVVFANEYLYPNNIAQAEAINSTLFSEDVVGRIDVTRNYVGRELNTEYLFGLFSELNEGNVKNLIGYSTNYDMVEFVGNCNQYVLGNINNGTFPTLGNISLPITINIWIKLNQYKQITQYDLTFPRFERLFDLIELSAYRKLSQDETATEVPEKGYKMLQQVLAESICEVHETYCQQDYPEYTSKEHCLEYLTKETRLGEDWEGGRDTVWCRSLHQNMIQYRPSVHCSHLGPSGGDMCTDEGTDFLEVTYNYDTTYNEPWIVV